MAGIPDGLGDQNGTFVLKQLFGDCADPAEIVIAEYPVRLPQLVLQPQSIPLGKAACQQNLLVRIGFAKAKEGFHRLLLG